MAIKEVLKMGDPRLLRVAEPVTEFGTSELQQTVDDMLDTMIALKGAGIAAPQIGINLRIVIFGFEHNPRYPDVPPIPLTVLINPLIVFQTEETAEAWEGCLSVPGMRGLVPRVRCIKYSGRDTQGHTIERTVADFHARVVQHECDHLDGVLYPQRIRDLTKFGFIEALEAAGLIPSIPKETNPGNKGNL
ncbi:MAG: peptide deformylase [Gammaproteobacteria bacterium]|nr:peptide deformylase [Gammaproteobacteria bacterium]